MKLKLDLHPIYNDARSIEQALLSIVDEAVDKRATEVEIIPGKGSGALKKTVIRFLDRPEIKARYHRIEKDSDNWGRLFIHFRPPAPVQQRSEPARTKTAAYRCFCCAAAVDIPIDPARLRESGPETRAAECPACGSPNRLTLRGRPGRPIEIAAASGYE